MLFICVSCGGSKNVKTNIVVSRGLSISNSGYEGGLTFYGKNLKTGDTFAYSSLPNSNQNQIVLDLQKGVWSFGVVGWSGAGPGKNLEGIPHCGLVSEVNLNSDSQTVSLNASASTCLSSAFADNSVVSTAAEVELKPLLLNFCAQINDGTINSYSSFCSTKNLNESRGDSIWSIKLQLASKPLPGGSPTAPIQSVCIPASQLGYFDLNNAVDASKFHLPTKNAPISIITYKDKSCLSPSSQFTFMEGLEANYGFDKKFFYPSSNASPKLFLASTKSKSEGTALDALIPEISCSGSSCSFIRPLPSGVDYYLSGDGPAEIILDPAVSCQGITSILPDSGLILGSCENRENGGASIRVSFDPNMGTPCTSGCYINYLLNGVSASKMIKSLGGASSLVLTQQETVLKTLGVENPYYTSPLVYSFGHLDSIRKSSGILHDVQEMLSSNVVAGAFKNIASCSNLTGVREIDVFDDGVLRRYQIEISSISESVPRQLCSTPANTTATGGCNDTFDKKISLRGLMGVVFVTQKVLKIDCNNRSGMSEDIHQSTNNNEARLEKKITYWNTPSMPSTNFKVQEYRYEKKSQGSQVNLLRTQVIDVSRSTVASAPILISDSQYEYHYNQGTPRETITKHELSIAEGSSGSVEGSTQRFESSNPQSVGEIFILPEIAHFLNTNSIHQHNSYTETTKVATSPDGNFTFTASFSTNGSSFTYRIVSSNKYKTGTGNLSATFSKGDISINDSGKVVIAYVSSSQIKYLTFSVDDATPAVTSSDAIDSGLPSVASKKVQVYLGNDDLITFSQQSYSGEVTTKITTRIGASPSGNTAQSYYQSPFISTGDFIVHHKNGNEARLCSIVNDSGYKLKCIWIKYPSFGVDNNDALISVESGVSNPTIMMKGFMPGDSIILYLDSSCINAASYATPIAGSTTVINTNNSQMGNNHYYYTVNGGACTNLNIGYYKSATGKYEANSETISLSGPATLIPRFKYSSGGDTTTFNLLDDYLFKKITVDASSITPTNTSGASLSMSAEDITYSKQDNIPVSNNNTSFSEFDQSDLPIKSPAYSGAPLTLKPQTFKDIFSESLQ
jgi:hypothetical protein